MNFGQPHRVLLFFERGEKWELPDKQHYLDAQKAYYVASGKVFESGTPVHTGTWFVALAISSDYELDELLKNDPAITRAVLQLVHALPYYS